MPAQLSPVNVFDRNLLRLRRDRAAENAADFDFLLADVADRLMDRLSLVRKEFPRVLDLGGHHGLLAGMLRVRPGTEDVFSCDMSPAMARAASRHAPAAVADEECLPFRQDSLDAVVSNLSLHWVNDLPGALLQVRQALRPDGLFLAALLGGETLHELRACLMEAELAVAGGASPRVSPFIDMRDMGALMQRAGFALPVVDSDIIHVEYGHPLRLMRDLRGMAAANAVHGRLKRPTRRAVVMEAARLYAEKFGTGKGDAVRATFQVIYAIGWKPHDSQQKPLRPGSATARLADALKAPEEKLD
jgi:SAM-dependent methyltransferase